MSTIFMSVGAVTLGRVTKDKDGNVVSRKPPQFTEDPAGGCVIIGKAELAEGGQDDDGILIQTGPVEVFGDYQAAEYLRRAVELLQPSRPINIPNFRAIVREAVRQGVDICECCRPLENQRDGEIRHTPACADCIVREWMEEAEE